jgi:nucleotide-binding universal stress UspA family protein
VIGYSRSDVLVIPEGKEVNFSRILLATDGSRDCENAISKALQLAVEYGSELRAVSIIDIPADYVIWEEVMKECIDKARGNVDAVVEKGEEVGVKVQVGIRQADAVEGVLREAEEWNASLIVLGTHGHTGLKRLLLGSVAAGVLSGNSFPVLVCP